MALPDTLRIVMAQQDFMVGDVDGNRDKIIASSLQARDHIKAHAIVFPELALTGYPPEDLLLRAGFIQWVQEALEQIANEVQGIDVIVGHPWPESGVLYNAASVFYNGQLKGRYYKQILPNYSVFDEKRYFESGDKHCIFECQGVPIGLSICEDIWHDMPTIDTAEAGARLLLSLNASPFHRDKREQREQLLKRRVKESPIPIIYVNLVGGQDELVFDGSSFVVNAEGESTQSANGFQEGLFLVQFDVEHDNDEITLDPVPATCCADASELARTYQALVLGVRDYVKKNGFNGAVLGLSGGIDSALTLAVAVDALGSDQVEAVQMPSRYTADMSVSDAIEEAEILGIKHHVVPIEPVFNSFLSTLEPLLADYPASEWDTTEENLQARSRGAILMALSNRTGKILLSTGNKSEMAVGYATLYGDMAGGFAVLKDVPKTLVYELAEYRNSLSHVIPQRVIDRPPSAELKPDQKDTDSLPDYAVLDAILEAYVEKDLCIEHIMQQGFAEDDVKRIVRMVDKNEYKRRQAAPGIKITPRAFGRDRRYPITSGFYRKKIAYPIDRE